MKATRPAPASASATRDSIRRSASPRAVALLAGLLSVAETLGWLGHPSFWFDEAATLTASRRTLTKLWQLCMHRDAVLGVYYAFMHEWVGIFGTSEVSVRAPSLIAYGITTYLTVLAGCRLFGRAGGMCAGLACMTIPGLTWAAIDARPTALATAAVAGSVYTLLIPDRDRTRGKAWLSAALLIVAGALQLTALLVAVVHVAVSCRRRRRRDLLPILVLGALLLPLALLGYQQRGQIAWLPRSWWQPVLDAVSQQFVTGARSTTVWVTAADLTAVVLGLSYLACTLVFVNLRARRLSLIGWAYLPGLLAVACGLIGLHVYNDRYFTVCTPGLALVIGGLCQRLSWRRAATIVAALAILAVPSLVAQRTADGKWGENLRATATRIQHAPADTVILYADSAGQSVATAYPDAVAGHEQYPDPRNGRNTASLWDRPPSPNAMRALLTESAGRPVLLLAATTSVHHLLQRLRPDNIGCAVTHTDRQPRVSTVTIRCTLKATPTI